MGVTHGKKADQSHQHLHSGCAQPLIGPDSGSDLSTVVGSDQSWDKEEDLDQNQLLMEHTDEGYYEELIRPKKLPNPVKASRSHRELHRELLITHKRGASEEKPELQRVLEQRNRAQALRQEREEEEEQRKKERTPLEQELLKRQLRLEKYSSRPVSSSSIFSQLTGKRTKSTTAVSALRSSFSRRSFRTTR